MNRQDWIISGIAFIAFLGTMLIVQCAEAAKPDTCPAGHETDVASLFSSKIHGDKGVFDLPLNPNNATAPSIEPRTGPNHTLIFNFNVLNQPITTVTAEVLSGVANASAIVINGSEVAVGLNLVKNQQYISVRVTASDGHAGFGHNYCAVVSVGFLAGNVSQSGTVTTTDLNAINSVAAQVIDLANFTADINHNGFLTFADKGIANMYLGTSLIIP